VIVQMRVTGPSPLPAFTIAFDVTAAIFILL
jgi:hypothetical protein